MKLRTISFVSLLILAACVPANNDSMGGHGDGHSTEGNARELSLLDETDVESGEIVFSVFSGDNIFTDYGVSHTKKMHLIVVRDDLRHFAHLHPYMNDQGAWQTEYDSPAGGTYWVYADFIEANGAVHTIRFDQTYPKDAGATGLVKEPEVREKKVDGLTVTLTTGSDDHGATFLYEVTDAQGKPVKLQPYLGALGHSVLINPAGGYIHTHPDEDSNELMFSVPGELKSDFYRAFTQFQVANKVHTVSFDWAR